MIDASIPLGVRPAQFESPINQLSAVLGIQQAQQANQLNALKADEYQRGVARQNRLRDLMTGFGNITDEQRVQRLRGTGEFLPEADTLEKSLLERQKTASQTAKDQAEADSKKFEVQRKKLDIAGQAFNFVRQNPTLETAHQVLDYLGQNNIYAPDQVAQYKAAVAADPSKIPSLAEMAFRSVLDAKDQLAKIETRNLGGTTETTGADPVTGQVRVLNTAQNTMTPGQVQEAKDREAARTQAERHFQTTQSNAGNQFDTERGVVVNVRTGEAKPVMQSGAPLGPKDKPLTDSQAKAALFGARAEQSDKILNDLAAQGTVKSIPGTNMPFVGGAITAVSPANQQRLEQAKRDFINAVLRRESGAVISPQEFDNAEKQYFPQIGDKPETIKQKAQNRATAIRGIQVEVPNSRAVVEKITRQSGGATGGWGIEKVN